MSWIPLLEYAVKKGISLSTLRRQIKSNKIQYRLEHGRYLLLESGLESQEKVEGTESKRAERLEQELKNARQEIADLKMLIALYEDQTRNRHSSIDL